MGHHGAPLRCPPAEFIARTEANADEGSAVPKGRFTVPPSDLASLSQIRRAEGAPWGSAAAPPGRAHRGRRRAPMVRGVATPVGPLAPRAASGKGRSGAFGAQKGETVPLIFGSSTGFAAISGAPGLPSRGALACSWLNHAVDAQVERPPRHHRLVPLETGERSLELGRRGEPVQAQMGHIVAERPHSCIDRCIPYR